MVGIRLSPEYLVHCFLFEPCDMHFFLAVPQGLQDLSTLTRD